MTLLPLLHRHGRRRPTIRVLPCVPLKDADGGGQAPPDVRGAGTSISPIPGIKWRFARSAIPFSVALGGPPPCFSVLNPVFLLFRKPVAGRSDHTALGPGGAYLHR